MKWVRRLLAHFGHARLTPVQRVRAAKERRVLKEADKVIEEYRKLDGALRIYIERRQHPR